MESKNGLFEYDSNSEVRDPNNYWQNPNGTFGFLFSVDIYPLSDYVFPFTLQGLQ